MLKFDFSAISKKDSKKTVSVTPKKSNRKFVSNNKIVVLYKDVKGVIFININSICYVRYKNKEYVINHSCYSCKGVEKVFRLGCDTPKKICHIRADNKKQELNNLYWIPFFAGSIVKGDIIYDNDLKITYFDIKKCNIKEFNEDSNLAYSFYKEHYKEINNNLIKRQIDANK